MPDLKVPLLKGDRVADDVQYRSHLPVNMYGVINPVHSVDGFMTSHSGFEQIGTSPGRDRGGIFNERLGQHLRVSGDTLIRVRSDGSIAEIGPIPGSGTQTSQASLPYSFNTQAIITGGRMWLYDGGSLTEVTDLDLGYPIDGCFIDGYYFLTDGETLYHTELDNEASIEPLKFATSEFSPDPTVGVAKTQDNQVMVFNRYTTEFFYNAGQEGFVFQRVAGKATKVGIIGTHCKVEMNGLFFCLGSAKEEAPTMLIIGAGKAQNYSTREVDNLLSTYTEGELRRTIMSTRTDDRDQLVYIHLMRHTLLYNHTIAEAIGKDYAWTILKAGILDDDPWLPINIIYDRDLNAWVSGVRTSGPGAPDPYSPSAYYNALRQIGADGIWILDDAPGSSVAADSSPFNHPLSIFGTRNYLQPSFIDDNGGSMYFGTDGYVIRGGGDLITSRNIALGFISTVPDAVARRVVAQFSDTTDAGIAVSVVDTGVRIELITDGDVTSHDNTVAVAVADGDAVTVDLDLDAAGVFTYRVYINYALGATVSGDMAATVTLDATSRIFAMFTTEGRMQYLWLKNGGITTENAATLLQGLTDNDAANSNRPVSGIVKFNDRLGSQDGNPVEYILTTPFINLESASIDEIEVETIPGLAVDEIRAFLSVTYDGLSYSREWTLTYSKSKGDLGRRFIFRRIGYCRQWMGFKLRLVTTEKVAFANMVVRYG